MSMKIIKTADFHFGVPGRLDDITWAGRVIREYAKQAGIDVVLVLGDLFHDRAAISIDVLNRAATFFEETAALDQKWITFPGNHDMFLRHSWSINSLVPFSKHLTVINGIKLLTLNDRRFWIVPFVAYEQSYMGVIRQLNNLYEEGDVLLTHIGVRGSTLNTCFLLKDWSVVSFDRSQFKKVYTGHFHTKQQVGENVWYPGSPIPFKFDEGDVSHGFYVYDMADGSHKFINIWKAGAKFFPDEVPPPQFMTLLDEQVQQEGDAPVKNNMVRVFLQRDHTDEEKRVMRNQLTDLGARSVRWMNLAQKEAVGVKMIDKRLQPVQYHQLFKNWVAQDRVGVKGLDLNILNNANADVTQKGDELYMIEEGESLV